MDTKIEISQINFSHRLTMPEEQLNEFYLMDSLGQMLNRCKSVVALIEYYSYTGDGDDELVAHAAETARAELDDAKAVLEVVFELRKKEKEAVQDEVKG